MKLRLEVLLIVGLFLSFDGCVTKGTPIVVLSRPQFVPQSQPDSLTESGIRQDPGTGGMFLQWRTVAAAAGYEVYRSDTTDVNRIPIHFTIIANVIPSIASNDTSVVDLTSLQTGVKYYYYLTAYAPDGNSSVPSDTINYTLLSRPSLIYPAPNISVNAAGLYFQWYDANGAGYTVIRVKDISASQPVTVWITKRFHIYDSSYPTRSFNFDSSASQQLISGHTYQWMVDKFDIGATGMPFEGSSSPWSTFTVK